MAVKKKNKKKTLKKKTAARKKSAAKAGGARSKKKTRGAKRTQGKQLRGKTPSTGRGSGMTGRVETDEPWSDMQGLSTTEGADSESVDELAEEGNAFEAGVVEGVEDAGARAERGVHTREVPEDDVPGEYLDED